MIMRAEWLEYSNMEPAVHVRDVTTEEDIRQLVVTIQGRSAEEVFLFPLGESDAERDRELNFQFNDDKTQAYITYGQRNLGVFESVGDPESPEQYTTSGGSFAAGTAVPVPDLEHAIVEFFHSGEKPTCLSWTEE